MLHFQHDVPTAVQTNEFNYVEQGNIADEMEKALEGLQNSVDFSYIAAEIIDELFNDNMNDNNMNNETGPREESCSNAAEDMMNELERFVDNYETWQITPQGDIDTKNVEQSHSDLAVTDNYKPQAISERRNATDFRNNDTDGYCGEMSSGPDWETLMLTDDDIVAVDYFNWEVLEEFPDGPSEETLMLSYRDMQAVDYFSDIL